MDQRSLDNLNTLHPKWRPIAINAWTAAQNAMPSNTKIIVVQGLRTFAESNVLFAQGRTTPGPIVTNAPAGESYHNYGLAFDFAMVTNGRNDYVVGPLWMKVVAIMKAAGMTWGGDFPDGQHDDPHFEQRYDYNWRTLLSFYNEKKFIPGTTYVNI